MRQWSVTAKAYSETEVVDPDLRAIDDLMDLLVDYGGVVSGGGNEWSATLTVEAPTLGAAVDAASDVLESAARKAGVPAWAWVSMEVLRDDEQDRELAKPNFPSIVGTTEAAAKLGVSRQRLHELRSASRFPEPLVTLAATPVWLETTVDGFLEQWERRTGRPPKTEAS